MITAEIPKDIRTYKSKFVGPFTLRQTICLALSTACIYGLWHLQLALGLEDPQYTYCTPGAIPLLFGWVEKQGLTLEQYLKASFKSNFLSPKIRTYQIENTYSDLITFDAIDVPQPEIQTEQIIEGNKEKTIKSKQPKKVKHVNSAKIKRQAAKENPMYKGYA